MHKSQLKKRVPGDSGLFRHIAFDKECGSSKQAPESSHITASLFQVFLPMRTFEKLE